MIPFLELTQLGKSYPGAEAPAVIVKNFNLKLNEGEFACIIGHSGCGKSTVLSIAMGLSEATEGGVIVAGREVVGPGLDRGVVFQSSALLPWLTARENVLLAVQQVHSHKSQKDCHAIAERFLASVGLSEVSESYPLELSAGMRQRVGIARAFAVEPKVLLLDEPFSLLDVVTRIELQDELMRLCARERKTVLMVTHDVDEALLLGDRIVMMTNGPAATVGEVVEVPFDRPRDRVAMAEDPRYHALRSQLLSFLEERAGHGQPFAAPQPVLRREIIEKLTPEDLFVIEKYTGFNRFRRKFRHYQAAAHRGVQSARAEVKALA